MEGKIEIHGQRSNTEVEIMLRRSLIELLAFNIWHHMLDIDPNGFHTVLDIHGSMDFHRMINGDLNLPISTKNNTRKYYYVAPTCVV